MTNDELILKGVREVYKQLQEIKADLKLIKKSVGTVELVKPKKDWSTIGKPKDEQGNVIETTDSSPNFKL